jgi:hypothetical protein
MQHIHFFQYNLPAENHFNSKTDHYVSVIAHWHNAFYDDAETRPIVSVKPMPESIDFLVVKDWRIVLRDAEKIAEAHFAEVAKQEKLNQANAEAIMQEMNAAPTLQRYTKIN